MNLQFFKIYFLLFYLCSIPFLFAQQGIGTNRPDPSSVLDVSSSNKGFLIPRMTTLQREAIINPALGLLVYDIDEDCLEINTSSNPASPLWECVGDGGKIVTSLACHSATMSGTVFTTKPAAMTVTIPYSGGDGSAYISETRRR